MSELKDKLLKAKSKPEKITVNGFGDMWVKRMSGKDRDEWEKNCSHRDKTDPDYVYKGFVADFVSRVACDENGELLWKDSAGDLGEIDSDVLRSIYDQGMAINKISRATVEEMQKN